MDTTRIDRTATAPVGARFSRRRALIGAGCGLAATALTFGSRGPRAFAQENAATPAAAPPPDWPGVDRLLSAAAPQTCLLAAELVDGAVKPIHALNAGAAFPVGSSFKLWILGALALKIQAGEIAWEQQGKIEERYKSVPAGDLRYAPAGTPVTIRYLAERMMQKSDNTATDHIFYLVGRENVERAMAAMGHSNPALNVPIISTRELALLKFAYPTEFVDKLYALPPEERRAVLNKEVDQKSMADLPDLDQTVPLEIDRVEWFATRHDLAATMAWLQAKAGEPEMLPVTEVIALETQLKFDGEVWPYVGFKGGSELGVLSGTWLLHRADGRRFVYSIGLENPNAAIDMTAAVTAMEAGRDRLALAP
jgi:beta-lactamase class A